jgi:hypothetical protein
MSKHSKRHLPVRVGFEDADHRGAPASDNVPWGMAAPVAGIAAVLSVATTAALAVIWFVLALLIGVTHWSSSESHLTSGAGSAMIVLGVGMLMLDVLLGAAYVQLGRHISAQGLMLSWKRSLLVSLSMMMGAMLGVIVDIIALGLTLGLVAAVGGMIAGMIAVRALGRTAI